MSDDMKKVSKKTNRVERYWINGKKEDLPIYQIDIERLHFNIANGRYADRMIRLQREHPGVEIDASKPKWKEKIEQMLAGEHRETQRDKTAFQELMEDLAWCRAGGGGRDRWQPPTGRSSPTLEGDAGHAVPLLRRSYTPVRH